MSVEVEPFGYRGGKSFNDFAERLASHNPIWKSGTNSSLTTNPITTAKD